MFLNGALTCFLQSPLLFILIILVQLKQKDYMQTNMQTTFNSTNVRTHELWIMPEHLMPMRHFRPQRHKGLMYVVLLI